MVPTDWLTRLGDVLDLAADDIISDWLGEGGLDTIHPDGGACWTSWHDEYSAPNRRAFVLRRMGWGEGVDGDSMACGNDRCWNVSHIEGAMEEAGANDTVPAPAPGAAERDAKETRRVSKEERARTRQVMEVTVAANDSMEAVGRLIEQAGVGNFLDGAEETGTGCWWLTRNLTKHEGTWIARLKVAKNELYIANWIMGTLFPELAGRKNLMFPRTCGNRWCCRPSHLRIPNTVVEIVAMGGMEPDAKETDAPEEPVAQIPGILTVEPRVPHPVAADGPAETVVSGEMEDSGEAPDPVDPFQRAVHNAMEPVLAPLLERIAELEARIAKNGTHPEALDATVDEMMARYFERLASRGDRGGVCG